MSDPSEAENEASYRRALGYLLAITVLLIAYASLYPFEFDGTRLTRFIRGDWPPALQWRWSNRSDVVANLLFYIPFGALFAMLTRSTRAVALQIAGAVLLGAALSVFMEILQLVARGRVSSLSDVALNAMSSGLGALAGIALSHPRSPRLRDLLRSENGNLALLVLLLLWIAAHSAPFFPRLGLYRAWLAAEPLRSLEWSAGGIAKFFAAYLILGAVLRALARRKLFWPVFLAVAAASLLARVTFQLQQLTLDECLGLLLSLPVILALRSRPHRQALVPTLCLVVIGLTLAGLAPFRFNHAAQAFGWTPFGGALDSSLDSGYRGLMEKAFWYAGACWMIGAAGFSLRLGGLMLALLLALIEAAQIFLPARVPEVTDPLLALLCAAFIHAARIIDGHKHTR